LKAHHPVLLSHLAKYRSLMPSLALIGHLIDSVEPAGGTDRARRGAAGGRVVRVPRRARAPAVRDGHGYVARSGRAAGDKDRSRPAGEPVSREEGRDDLPDHILTVRAIVEPTHEEQFNRWYNQDIADVLSY
jgi:hypothetical protein